MQLPAIHSIMPCTTPAQTQCRNFTKETLDTAHETLQGTSTSTNVKRLKAEYELETVTNLSLVALGDSCYAFHGSTITLNCI